MTFNTPTYVEYKESGIPWIGRIPREWRTVPNKSVLRRRADLVGLASAEYTLLSLTKRGVIPRDLENPGGKFPADFGTYQIVRPNDLVFCLFDVDETPRTVGLSRQTGMISGAYTRFECSTPTVARYLNYLYMAVDDVKGLRPLYTGLRKVVKTPTFLAARVPLPPSRDLQAILRYLEHFVPRVDRAILAKRKLIALLEEQKRTISEQLVLRGFDAEAETRPSGVQWLGDIPVGWKVKRGKQLFAEIDVRSTTGEEELLSVSHLTGVTPRRTKNITMFKAESYVGHKLCQAGDLVVNTMWAWMGALGAAKEPGIVSPAYAVYRALPGNDLDMRYADLLLRSSAYVSDFHSRSTGIQPSRLRLYPDQFLTTPLLLPPIEEQAAISVAVTNRTRKLSTAVSHALKEIALLEEYRTRLVADVVTGALDVRDASDNLPEIPDEFLESAIVGREFEIPDDEDEFDGEGE